MNRRPPELTGKLPEVGDWAVHKSGALKPRKVTAVRYLIASEPETELMFGVDHLTRGKEKIPGVFWFYARYYLFVTPE